MSSWDTNSWSNLCDNSSVVTNDTQGPWKYIHHQKQPQGHTSMRNVALKQPWYFYLLMEKLFSRYFQVSSPYYQAAQCKQKTTIPVFDMSMSTKTLFSIDKKTKKLLVISVPLCYFYLINLCHLSTNNGIFQNLENYQTLKKTISA